MLKWGQILFKYMDYAGEEQDTWKEIRVWFGRGKQMLGK